MLILANLLTIALIAADEPSAKTPIAPASPIAVEDPPVNLTNFTGSPAAAMPKVPRPRTHENPEADELWNMTLPEAIRIGLDNSEVIRVLWTGKVLQPDSCSPIFLALPKSNPAEIVIAKLDPDADAWKFKADVLAHVRSIEQTYWALSSTHANLQARESALKQGEESLRRERADLENLGGRNSRADVAEAEQHLEQFKLDLVTATSDVITTERQLRNLLGLPAADNRRIIPSTSPSRLKVDPVWEECLATMQTSDPAIVEQRLKLEVARREAIETEVLKQQASLTETLHKETQALARYFLEVDANFKQFQAGQKLRIAADQRLAAQQAFYNEGRITIDRLLDAIAQQANAVAKEGEFLATYNTSMAMLEEAKGTLLTTRQIVIAEAPVRKKAMTEKPRDAGVAPVSFDGATPAPKKPEAASTTYKIRARFGQLKLFDVEIEIRPSPK